MPSNKEIIPAILTQNPREHERRLRLVEDLASWVQVDFMDGTSVDNYSISLGEMRRIETGLKIELHLMVLNPERYFEECAKNTSIKRVVFHLETVDDPLEALFEMEKYEFEKGIALNPGTEVTEIKSFVDKIDSILLLSVNPGYGGQEFIPETIDKIKKARGLFPDLWIEVDGGINEENIGQVFKAGADGAVVGSGFFKAKDVKSQFKKLQSLVP